MQFNTWTGKGLIAIACIFMSVSAWARLQIAEYVYTANNNASGNGIHAYRVDSSGELNELSGSPFATGGLGNNTSPFSQDGIITSADGRFLFAVNLGSNDISVFYIRQNGELISVPGSPFATGGTYPVSLALSGNILYASHAGVNGPALAGDCTGCDLRGFRVSHTGTLHAIPGSVVDLSDFDSAFPIVTQFNPDGDVLMVSRFAFSDFTQPDTPELHSYKLNRFTGLLTPAPGSPYVPRAGSNRPIGMAFNPVDDSQLFVSISVISNLPVSGAVSTYLMGGNGQIAELEGSPIASNTSGRDTIATCWLELTSDGRHLYASNTGSDNLSWYTVDEAGHLTLREVIDVPPVETALDFPVDLLISHNDEYLYTLQTTIGTLTGWHINNDGSLSLLANQPVPLPQGSIPYGLASVRKVFFAP